MGNEPVELSDQDYRRAARGFTVLAWAFVFLLYLGVSLETARLTLLLPPPTVGWLLFLWGLWLLPSAPELRTAVTWALAALVLSIPAGFVLTRLEQAHAWYRVLRTGALLASYLLGVAAVFCLLGFGRRFAERAGAAGLAADAPLRAWLFTISALMPLAQVILNTVLSDGPVWPLMLPPVVSVVAITAIVSYIGAFVRLCSTAHRQPRQRKAPPGNDMEAAVEDLWEGSQDAESPHNDSPA
jgi:hypothetical protein